MHIILKAMKKFWICVLLLVEKQFKLQTEFQMVYWLAMKLYQIVAKFYFQMP